MRWAVLHGALSSHDRHPEGHWLCRLIRALHQLHAAGNTAGHSRGSQAAPALLEHSRRECTISEVGVLHMMHFLVLLIAQARAKLPALVEC